jgi:ABC-type multidrug transport system fused ATPase/permease subunit
LEADITTNILDTAINDSLNELLKMIPFIAGVILFSMAVRFLTTYFSGSFLANLIKKLRMCIIDKLKGMPISFLEESDSGRIASSITYNLDTVREFSQGFLDLISSLILGTGLSVYLICINWRLFLLSILVLPIFLAVTDILKKNAKDISKKENEFVSNSNSVLVDSIRGREIVKTYNLKGRLTSLYNKYVNLALDSKIKFERSRSITGAMSYFIVFIPILVCISYGGHLTVNRVISPGQLTAFIYVLRQLIDIVSNLPDKYLNLQKVYGALNHIFDVIDRSNERTGGEIFETANSANIIEFIDVEFSYKGDKSILNGLNISINSGEKVAIVGPSGCGKSTIIKLICGFYENYKGVIKFCGKDLREWKLSALRENISVIPQDIYLFPGPIEENISFGKINPGKEEIHKAAQIANAHDFITGLPDGYDTNVSEMGKKLSGGQRQRIGIARAIIKSAPILILDEPTSSLDAESENLIYDELADYIKNKTVVIISHRFSTIMNADRIYVINKGRLVEEGTHNELINKESLYKSMFIKQRAF